MMKCGNWHYPSISEDKSHYKKVYPSKGGRYPEERQPQVSEKTRQWELQQNVWS